MKTIGFVGTAKNAGKTTAALHMLDLLNAAGARVALTSIGYDGENLDHITGLPKPRYAAQPGMLIATSSGCLNLGDAGLGRREPTGLNTLLGEIIIAEVTRPGFVVLAGPNRKKDLASLLNQLAGLGVEVTLVDGALNRLAAMAAVDGMVFSTGAALDERSEVVAAHAGALEGLFHFARSQPADGQPPGVVTYARADGEVDQMDTGSLLDENDLQKLTNWLEPGDRGVCVIPGVCLARLFQRLVEEHPGQLEGNEFVFASPLNLLAAGSPLVCQASFSRLADLGGQVSYLAPMPLHFMAVNPFYPRYLQKTGSYVAEYVDKVELLRSVRAAVQSTPVIDVRQPPHPDLLNLCGVR